MELLLMLVEVLVSISSFLFIESPSDIEPFALYWLNRIAGIMVGVLASSVVDCGFEPGSGQTKDYKIGICCFSAKHTASRRKSND